MRKAVCGIFLGWKKNWLAFFMSGILALIVRIPLLLRRRENCRFAFAPYLSTGVLLMALWGDMLLKIGGLHKKCAGSSDSSAFS